jgi:endonuclease III-like uncharacterized protein
MLNFSEWLNENKYTEIEFVCVNSSCPLATSKEQQNNLKSALLKLTGVHILHQNWSTDSKEQLSLSVVITDKTNESTILKVIKTLAKEYGVRIDLINKVSDKYIDMIVTKSHDNQI